MSLTGSASYFEDFQVGDVYQHTRGRTVMEMENTLITHMTMNTASTHFNRDLMRTYMDGRFPDRLVNGGFTLSLVVGLTSEDISENSVADVGYANVRMHNPVFPGDTLYAESEILGVEETPLRPDAGLVRYRFRGFNDKGSPVVEGERTILVKKRAYWPSLGAP
jgi:itaconyl-CoA hydratase